MRLSIPDPPPLRAGGGWIRALYSDEPYNTKLPLHTGERTGMRGFSGEGHVRMKEGKRACGRDGNDLMEVSQEAVLTYGPIGKMLARLTAPMILGTMAIATFYLADSFFLGRLGTLPLAAIGFSMPVIIIITGISFGIGGGVSATLSRAIGGEDKDQVRHLTADSLLLTLLIAIILSVTGIVTINPVFQLLGATQVTMPFIRQYMTILYGGILFIFVQAVLNDVFRATGDMVTPSILLVAATVMNFLLDPLLIFGLGPFPRWEMTGAALATVISLAIPPPVSLLILHLRKTPPVFARPKLRTIRNSWKKVLYIGLPSAITNSLMPIGFGVITKLTAAYGPIQVAALGVGTQIDGLVMTILTALATVIGPYIGQNIGAGKLDRVRKGLRYAQLFSIAWGLGMILTLNLTSRSIAFLFSDDPQLISDIRIYLLVVPPGLGFRGLLMLSNAALNVFFRPIQASSLTLEEIFLFTIPLACFGSRFLGLYGIFGSIAAGRTAAGIIAFFWLQRVLNIEEGLSRPSGRS
ncbi:MAG: MATE family efflux transporter [bacterium]